MKSYKIIIFIIPTFFLLNCSNIGLSEYYQFYNLDCKVENDYLSNNSYRLEFLRFENSKPNVAIFNDSSSFISVKLLNTNNEILFSGLPLFPIIPVFLLNPPSARQPDPITIEIKIGFYDTNSYISINPRKNILIGDNDTLLYGLCYLKIDSNRFFGLDSINSFLSTNERQITCSNFNNVSDSIYRCGTLTINYEMLTWHKYKYLDIYLDGLKINNSPIFTKPLKFKLKKCWDYIGFYIP